MLRIKENAEGQELYKRSETGKRVDLTIEDRPAFGGQATDYQLRLVSGAPMPEDVGPWVRQCMQNKDKWVAGKKSSRWVVPGHNVTIYILNPPTQPA